MYTWTPFLDISYQSSGNELHGLEKKTVIFCVRIDNV